MSSYFFIGQFQRFMHKSIHHNKKLKNPVLQLKEKKGHGYLMVMFKVSQFQRENQYILSKDLLVYWTCKEGCKQGQTKKYNFKSSLLLWFCWTGTIGKYFSSFWYTIATQSATIAYLNVGHSSNYNNKEDKHTKQLDRKPSIHMK